jgi:hypothetical protein
MAVSGQSDWILPAQVQSRTSDHGHIVRVFHQEAIDAFAKNSDAGGVDGTELRDDGIMLSGLEGVSVFVSIRGIE